MKICSFLRWKGYSEECSDAELAYIFARNSVPYTCLRTCQPWGMDDGPAEPESCRPDRLCFGGVLQAELESDQARGVTGNGEGA